MSQVDGVNKETGATGSLDSVIEREGKESGYSVQISVVVCTRNRAGALHDTLRELLRMEVPAGLTWEILVVDNNSSDQTRQVILEHAASAKHLRYAYEDRPGLANARNKGITEAVGEIIAFTDDDCLPDVGWLAAIAQDFVADPVLSLLGGRVELFDPTDQPVTLRRAKDRVVLTKPSQIFSLVAGCNMVFRREVCRQVGMFDPRFGAGTLLSSAEDSDFLFRAYRLGFKLAYSPDLLVLHNHGRKTEEQVRALNRGYVIGRGAFYCKHIVKGDWQAIGLAGGEVFSLTRVLVKRLLTGRPISRQVRQFWFLMKGSAAMVMLFLRRNETA